MTMALDRTKREVGYSVGRIGSKMRKSLAYTDTLSAIIIEVLHNLFGWISWTRAWACTISVSDHVRGLISPLTGKVPRTHSSSCALTPATPICWSYMLLKRRSWSSLIGKLTSDERDVIRVQELVPGSRVEG